MLPHPISSWAPKEHGPADLLQRMQFMPDRVNGSGGADFSHRFRGFLHRRFAGPALICLMQLGLTSGMGSAAEAPPDAQSAPAADPAFFEKKIRPLFVNHCYSCHSADTKAAGGLRVDDRNGLLTGGDAGPAVIPGDAAQSLLLKRLLHADEKRRMPRESDPLTPEQIEDLTAWVQAGAAWPAEAWSSPTRTNPAYPELIATHWAWQPLSQPVIPDTSHSSWPANPVDSFILAGMDSKQLAPVGDASPEVLLRRIHFDLTGLPPSPEDLALFEADPSPAAYARTVDRLLDSPGFGERWGRHWLDVARYGESTGPSRNIPYPHAWRYRDYVIDAFRRDIPFDRFLREQIAGDLLPSENGPERDRLLTATGFLALGVKDVNQRFKVRFVMDNVDEQIDTVTRSVLALTVSCARCHDHKFDPVSQSDYYALAGIFTSTDDCAGVRNKMGGAGLDYYNPQNLLPLSSPVPPAPPEEVERLTAATAEAKKAWDSIRGTPEGLKRGPNGQPTQRPFRLKYERLQAELQSLTDPGARGHAVHGVRESAAIGDTEIRIRGEAERLGPPTPRGFPGAIKVPGAAPVETSQSGRLQLAEWLTHPANPLTPRVYVNRIWKHLFRQGLVSTVDNFGVTGTTPSHPALLDYLAGQFSQQGWSTRRLIRTLVLSHTYRLDSSATPAHLEADPSNRFLWRHAPRRLDAEEIRDAILFSGDRLDQAAPEASAARSLRMVEIRDNGTEARSLREAADRSTARSIYLPLVRGITPKALEAFDPVSQSLVTGQREATTVPAQALFLLNSGFVRKHSLAVAAPLAAASPGEIPEAIARLYRRILGRNPTAPEQQRALVYLQQTAADFREHSPQPAAITEAPSAQPAEESSAAPPPVPANPDDIDRTPQTETEEVAHPANPEEAAWLHLIQALYASAEFQFVR